MAVRLTTTRQDALQPLAVAGQSTIEAWRTLHALLGRELTPAHAALLSEPVVNAARGEVDWYAASDAPATRLTSLPDAERAAVDAKLEVLVTDIEALRARLATGRGEADRFLAEMLGLALRLPGRDWVFVQDGEPMLAAWGQARLGEASAGFTLSGTVATRSVAMPILPPPPSPYAAGPNRAPLWAALALLLPLLVLGLWWKDPFGWLVAEPGQCRIAPSQLALSQALQDEAAREGVLRTELAQITAEAGQRRLMCPPVLAAVTPPPPIPPTPPPPPPPPPGRDTERADRQGAQRGKLQIILAWDDHNDLDLHVICPNGQEISYLHRGACGGRLDVDANGDVNTLTNTPIENVFFNDPRPGRYRVVVDPYGMRVRGNSAFRVTIRREGRPDEVITGVAGNGRHNQTVTVVEVERPGDDAPPADAPPHAPPSSRNPFE